MAYELDLDKFKKEYSEYETDHISGVIAIRDEDADDKYVYHILARTSDKRWNMFAYNELTQNTMQMLRSKE